MLVDSIMTGGFAEVLPRLALQWGTNPCEDFNVPVVVEDIWATSWGRELQHRYNESRGHIRAECPFAGRSTELQDKSS